MIKNQFLAAAAILVANFTIPHFTMSAQINWSANPVGAVFARQGGESPEGTFRLTSGGYEVFTLAVAENFELDRPASLFYSKDLSNKARVDALAPTGSVASAMNCFLVRIGDDYIMIDTGFQEGRGNTLRRLAALGVDPKEIKSIFITHAHGDHVGGLTDAEGKCAFPSAKLYIPEAEVPFMEETMADVWKDISNAYSGRIDLIGAGTVLPFGLLPIAAPGHTPGHTVYRLGNLLFAGDILHGASIQLVDTTINASFDRNPGQSVASRNAILGYAAANSLTVLGAHVPLNGVLF